ncbi:uncharacterized protein LOC122808532 [Protopterus annectens]|uniref:uncharacterized protein LOC122808532 n=1 Tax=Protopterus annectens TaxID=7888 RepID=UPI001CF9AF5E|nr:uncharacterized protein LOC122808532 [Protopterus annectens]
MGRDWKDLDLLQWLPLLFLTVMILNEANTDDFIFCGKINHTHRPRALNITWKNSTGCNIQIESKNRNIIINAPLTKACEGGTMKDNLQNSSKICIKWHRANHSLIVWYGPKQYKHCQNVTRILKCRFYVLEKSKSQGCGQKPYICWENAILNRTNLTLAWFYKFHGFSSDCGDLDNWDLNVNNTKNVSVDNYMSATNTFMTFCKCKHNCGKILTSLELLILNAANKKGRRVLSKGKIRAIVINEDNIFDELVINSRDFLKEGINESKFSIKLPGTILDKVQQYPRQQRKFLFLSIRSASLFQYLLLHLNMAASTYDIADTLMY